MNNGTDNGNGHSNGNGNGHGNGNGNGIRNGKSYPLGSHLWANGGPPRQIVQDGRTIVHHRCVRCGRDFALELDGSGWHALYVGLLRFELLAESVNQRWLAEKCPGIPLWDRDRDDRTTRRA
jgi:hypothetical protein